MLCRHTSNQFSQSKRPNPAAKDALRAFCQKRFYCFRNGATLFSRNSVQYRDVYLVRCFHHGFYHLLKELTGIGRHHATVRLVYNAYKFIYQYVPVRIVVVPRPTFSIFAGFKGSALALVFLLLVSSFLIRYINLIQNYLISVCRRVVLLLSPTVYWLCAPNFINFLYLYAPSARCRRRMSTYTITMVDIAIY